MTYAVVIMQYFLVSQIQFFCGLQWGIRMRKCLTSVYIKLSYSFLNKYNFVVAMIIITLVPTAIMTV